MKLTKKSDTVVETHSSETSTPTSTHNKTGNAVSRRQFLRSSSLMAGGAALASTLAPSMMKKSQAEDAKAETKGKTKMVKTICTHCSVGCGVIAEVKNGVWTGQEPALDHPFNGC